MGISGACPGPGHNCFSCGFPDCILRACIPNSEETAMMSASKPRKPKIRPNADLTALRGIRSKVLPWTWNPAAYQENLVIRQVPKQEIETELQKEYGQKLRPIVCSMAQRQTRRLDVVEAYFLRHAKEDSPPDIMNEE